MYNGDKIKLLRSKLNLSQDSLATATGIPKGRIAQWELRNTVVKQEDALILDNYFVNAGILSPSFGSDQSDKTDSSKSIVERLKDWRKYQNKSVLDVEKITGIPKDRIYSWERGKGNPKSEDEKVIIELIAQKEFGTNTPYHMKATESDLYRDKYITLLEKQLSIAENNENALRQSVSLLMNQIKEMSNESKINYANVELMLQEIQFQLLHHQRFSLYVSSEALKKNLQDMQKASDKIKDEILQEAGSNGR